MEEWVHRTQRITAMAPRCSGSHAYGSDVQQRQTQRSQKDLHHPTMGGMLQLLHECHGSTPLWMGAGPTSVCLHCYQSKLGLWGDTLASLRRPLSTSRCSQQAPSLVTGRGFAVDLEFYKCEAAIERSRGTGCCSTPPEEQKQEASASQARGEKMHREGQIATTPTPGSAGDGIRGGAEILHASTDTYVQSANHPITLAGKACVPL